MEIKQIGQGSSQHDCCAAHAPAGEIDPICGMTVDPAFAAGQYAYAGKTFYFCSRHCLEKFKTDPARYFAGPSELPRPANTSAKPGKYTCPMHPEIVQDGPGSCPKCGMALEPVSVGAADAPDPELADMTRRLRMSAPLAAPLVVISMISMHDSGWIQLALATPVVLWGGAPFFKRAWASVRRASPNMFTLIALGTGAAYLSSVVSLFTSPHPALYFESAAVIVTLVLVGQVLELRARRATGSAIRALLGLAPKSAKRIDPDGLDRDVPLAEIKVGDRLRVRTGERIPADGVVEEGATSL